MSIATKPFVFHLPPDFDERAEYEMPLKGYLTGGEVEWNGARYPVTFFEPVRLGQDLTHAGEHGVAVVAEPALVVIPDVTREVILLTVEELLRQRFFDHLKPLPAPATNPDLH